MKKRNSERGSHHLVLVVGIVVALIGVLGFVGYNAWQRQVSNAGSTASLGQLQTKLKNAEAKLASAKKAEATALKNFNNKRKNEKKEDPEIAKLYTQLNKATKAASGLPNIDVLNQRVAERQAEVTRLEGRVREATDALAAAKVARDAAKPKNKAAKQAIVDDLKQKKENREANLAEAQRDLRKAQDKQAAQNAVIVLTAKIENRRQTWKQWDALVTARTNVQKAQDAVNKAKQALADAKKKSGAKDDGKKSTPKPGTTPVRASCPKDKPIRGLAKGVCYPQSSKWTQDGSNACQSRSLGSRVTTICKVKRTVWYEISSGSGVGFKTERKQSVKSRDIPKPAKPTCSYVLTGYSVDSFGSGWPQYTLKCQ